MTPAKAWKLTPRQRETLAAEYTAEWEKARAAR